ncbi:TlpA family protein disulfide reductase [Flavobacterium sp. WC2509]|uniref:TlpA family protein disulfide reductase n=1 Tax=Flavobacterium sp. WC2509 TaxID=3461406 RepID=UPI004044CC0C
MKKIILLALFFPILSFAQEKKIWAKSYLNQQAPKLVVGQWISEEPNITGKFILIDFWATWCAPCKLAIPKLNKLQKEFKDNLIVIGLSHESKSNVKEQTNPTIEYYSAIDTKKRLETLYEITNIPHCVIINPEGVVVWEGFPFSQEEELTSEVIKDLMEKIDYSTYSIAELNSKKTELELESNYVLVNDYLEKIEKGDISHIPLTNISKTIIKRYWDNIPELQTYNNNWKEANLKLTDFIKKHAPELTELLKNKKNGVIDNEEYIKECNKIYANLRTDYPDEYPVLIENNQYNLKLMWKATARYILEDYRKNKKTFPTSWIPEKQREISENKRKYKVIKQRLVAVQNEMNKKA